MVGFDVSQQQINLIRRFNSNVQTPDSAITHCDLFFADAVVLVEGTVEKLLLPDMIRKSAPSLSNKFLTVLEVGGAYAHRFASLLEFLEIPYLAITDIDSVNPDDNGKVCRADTPGALTSNASLKFFFNKATVSDIVGMSPQEQILAKGYCYVAFQKPTVVHGFDIKSPMHARTFEEAFIYENIQLIRDNEITFGKKLPDGSSFDEEYQTVFERIKSSSFKKTKFALDIASSTADWVTPQYIADGLRWLAETTGKKAVDGAPK